MIYLAPPNTQQVRQAIGAGKPGDAHAQSLWSGLNEEASRGFPFIGSNRTGASPTHGTRTSGDHGLSGCSLWFHKYCLPSSRDVVADHAATLELWKRNFAQVHTFGYPAAFVFEDGATYKDVPWSELDVLFIGGIDRLQAAAE